MDDRDFVFHCYETLLGRPRDEEGVAHYAERLSGGMPRTSLEEILCASDECCARAAARRHPGACDRMVRHGGRRAVLTGGGPPHPRSSLAAAVQPIDERVWDRYDTTPVDLRVDRFQTPHLLLKHDAAIFTSVYVFLEKR